MVYVFLGLFVLLLILELSTVNFITIWFALGALAAFVVTYFTDSAMIQWGVFVLVSALSLMLTRPFIKKVQRKHPERTNLDRVIGKVGIVTEDISKNQLGEVKVDGKRWTAISENLLEKGCEVDILAIDGVKLQVMKHKEEE